MLNLIIRREFGNCCNMDCRLQKGLTELYSNDEKSNNIVFECPKDLGEGSFSKIISNKNLEIYKISIRCKKNLKISCRTIGKAYMLKIFNENKAEWLDENSKSHFRMREGEAILYKIEDIIEHSECKENSNYGEVTIIMSPELFNNYLSLGFLQENIFKSDYKNFKMNKFHLPIETHLIIQQIINCTYNSKIKNMYIEGKVLELFSICLNNIMERNSKNNKDYNLSKIEIEVYIKQKKF